MLIKSVQICVTELLSYVVKRLYHITCLFVVVPTNHVDMMSFQSSMPHDFVDRFRIIGPVYSYFESFSDRGFFLLRVHVSHQCNVFIAP